jgi:uncharacterized repeat protein (TIGR01451 family)
VTVSNRSRGILVAFALAVLVVFAGPSSASPTREGHSFGAGPGADLAIAKTGPVDGIVGGGTATYTIVVTNLGPGDATGVTVDDAHAPGAVFDPEGSSSECSAVTARLATCEVGSLPASATATLLIVVTLPCISGTITDVADVSALQFDPDEANNESTAGTTVLTPCLGVSESIDDGGTISTDPEGTGPDPSVNVFETASILVPQGISGDASIALTVDTGDGSGSPSDECPSLFDLVATTTSPPGTQENFLTFIFRYDACAIPPGSKINKVDILKSPDGLIYEAIEKCRGHSPNSPDPCLKKRKVLEDGDFQFTVLWSGTEDPSWRPG